jgi:hypothetical protein
MFREGTDEQHTHAATRRHPAGLCAAAQDGRLHDIFKLGAPFAGIAADPGKPS